MLLRRPSGKLGPGRQGLEAEATGQAGENHPGRRAQASHAFDRFRRLGSPAATAASEAVKVGREMLVIPAQAFMAVAEFAGAACCGSGAPCCCRPCLRSSLCADALPHFGQRHVTPARGVIVVAIFRRGRARRLAVARLPRRQRRQRRLLGQRRGRRPRSRRPDRASRRGPCLGDVAAGSGRDLRRRRGAQARRSLGRLLISVGVAAIAISAADRRRHRALDEGSAAIVYEGAEARLLEGFWVQLVPPGSLIACGLLLPRYLRATRAATRPGGRDYTAAVAAGCKGSPPAPRRRQARRARQDGR